MFQHEIWKPYPTCADYEASTLGRVRRVTRKKGAKAGRILKQTPTPAGYVTVSPQPFGQKFVHVVVLETFAGPCPDGLEARHLNDVKNDNRITNLCWGTHAENYADRVRNGGGNHGQRHGLAKLTDAEALEILQDESGRTQTEIAAAFNVSRRTVGSIRSRNRWRHLELA